MTYISKKVFNAASSDTNVVAIFKWVRRWSQFSNE